MGKHNFYDINFYKTLKSYVNSWGPDGPTDDNTADVDGDGDGWVVLDATASE